MKKLTGILLLSLVGITLAACSSGDETAKEKSGTATQKTVETSNNENTSSTDTEELEEGVAARNKYTVNWSEDWHDVNFKITDVSVVEYNDEQAIAALDTTFIAGVKFVITNNSDHKISTYPDQGKLVINGKQYDANMFVSDDVGGEVMNGSSIEGVVAYPLKDIASVDDVKEIRVVWSANDFDSGDMTDTGKDFDIPLQLTTN